MGIIQRLAKFVLTLLLFTALGQLRLSGRSIEDRYHVTVNSEAFQGAFWTAMTPVTWTFNKVASLVTNKEHGAQAR